MRANFLPHSRTPIPQRNTTTSAFSKTTLPHLSTHLKDTCLTRPIVPIKFKIFTQYFSLPIFISNYSSDSLCLPKMQPEFYLMDLFKSTIITFTLKMQEICWDLNKTVYFIYKTNVKFAK